MPNEIMRAGVRSVEAEDSPTALEAKHSPLPWRFLDAEGRLPIVREIKRPHGEASHYQASLASAAADGFICWLDFGYGSKADRANAQLIVHRVNNFDALVAVARALVACDDESDLGLFSRRVSAVIDEAKAAIKNAEAHS